MLTGVVIFLLIAVSIMWIHKLGHYAAGRVVGIPPDHIRLVVLSLPQYVALDDGKRWVSPLTFEAYLAAYRQYDPEERYLVAFLAAGLLAQTASVVVLAGFGLLAGVPFVGQSAVLVSGMLTSFHLFSDLGARLHLGAATGDFSALFEQSPVTTVLLLVGFVGSHAVLYAQF